jgi:hypothetical protein
VNGCSSFCRRTPTKGSGNVVLHPVTRRLALLQDAVVKDAELRQVHAGDIDDGLPRGFLAGSVVEVWLALRLNWA